MHIVISLEPPCDSEEYPNTVGVGKLQTRQTNSSHLTILGQRSKPPALARGCLPLWEVLCERSVAIALAWRYMNTMSVL